MPAHVSVAGAQAEQRLHAGLFACRLRRQGVVHLRSLIVHPSPLYVNVKQLSFYKCCASATILRYCLLCCIRRSLLALDMAVDAGMTFKQF